MRFFYLRDVNGHKIGCLASQLDRLSNTVKFAISVCNPLDTFNSLHARELAAGRLAMGTYDTVIVDKNHVKYDILAAISASPSYPQRARVAARVWLMTTHVQNAFTGGHSTKPQPSPAPASQPVQ
jgi:hypothetical protein